MMSTKIKEAMISQGMESTNVRLVELALRPGSPFAPNKKRSIFQGMIVGLAIGVGLAFFLEYMDRTVRKPEDLERHFGLPVLGVIQDVSTAEGRT